MKWSDFDHNFCEGYIYGMPEYFNSISSVIMMIFGLIGILNSLDDFVIKLIYTILVSCGIGSIFYHWFGSIGWALFDEFPMILMVFITILYVNEILVQIRSIQMKIKRFDYLYYSIKTILAIILMTYLLVSNTMSDYRLDFPMYFGVCLVYLMYDFIKLSNEFSKLKLFIKKNDTSIINQNIIPYRNKYLFYVILSALIWITTEKLCKYFTPSNLSNISLLFLQLLNLFI